MSWDVVIMNFGNRRPASLEEIWEMPTQSLGSAQEVQKRISEALPEVRWEAPGVGIYLEDEDLSLEFNFTGKRKVDHVIVNARGSGDAIGSLLRVANTRLVAAGYVNQRAD